MSEIESLKKILGIGFSGSVLTEVESQIRVINGLKSALGLPPDASPGELPERISALKAEHETLQEQGEKRKTIPTKEGKGMDEQTKAGEGTAGTKAVEKWYQKGKCIVGLITAVGILIFGTFWIILYALQAEDWQLGASIFGVAALLGAGFFTSGCLLGFMFGIPKLRTLSKTETPKTEPPQPEPPKPEPPKPATQSTSVFEVNTNLEQVSDWLTKIVVGLGLTQIYEIPSWLKKYAKALSSNLGGPQFQNAEAFAVGLLIYYLTFGFLSGYLLTRLFLKEELEEAEETR